jgi:quercetin dioxygenase-like cupin family protein
VCDDGGMAELIERPALVEAAGSPPKRIAEYVGRVNTGTEALSLAVMQSPGGWAEPGQAPGFEEWTIVLEGQLLVETRSETITVSAGQAVHTAAGEWVRYSSPAPGGARYVSACLPAFSPQTVYRDPHSA